VYADMRSIIPEQGGRFIDDIDMQDRKRVALIGDEVRRLLFGEGEAVGKLIYVDQVPFLVVGVMQKKTQSSSYNRRDQDRVFIPASTFASVFGAFHVNNIIYTPKDPRESEQVQDQVRNILGKRYRFDPADKKRGLDMGHSRYGKNSYSISSWRSICSWGSSGASRWRWGDRRCKHHVYRRPGARQGDRRQTRGRGQATDDHGPVLRRDVFHHCKSDRQSGFLIAWGSHRCHEIYIPIKDFVGTPEISAEVTLANRLRALQRSGSRRACSPRVVRRT